MNYNISTVAGSVAAANGDAVSAGLAPLFNPQAVVIDSAGNVYIADGDAHRVRKIDATGNISVIAGQGRATSSGDASVQGTASALNDPTGLALSPDGTTLYIAEYDASKVKALNLTTGALTTIVGYGGRSGFAGDGSSALYARVRNPYALATDSAGNLYIADRGNNKIRKVCIATKVKTTDCTTGNITTVAGIGPINADPGYLVQFGGDGGLATRAQLARPEGVAVDSKGNIFIADTNNNAIRKVDVQTANGDFSKAIITTVAGACVPNAPIAAVGSAPAQNGNTQLPVGTIWPTCASPAGVPTTVNGTAGVLVTPNTTGRTAASISTASTNANQRTNPLGITFIDGAPAPTATLNSPRGLAFDTTGNLYIADTGTNRIRVLDTNGVLRTVAGSGTSSGYAGDGGPANTALLLNPRGVAVAPNGDIYFTDQTQGVRSSSAGTGKLRVVDAGSLTIRTVTSKQLANDGAAITSDLFNDPRGLAVDAAGNIIIVDSNNSRIRKLSTSGTLTTLAGSLGSGFSGDTGPAASSRVSSPSCAAVDANGNIYFADRANNRIRKIDSSGNITTIAGGGAVTSATEGVLAVNAKLNAPRCVAVDAAGNVYIADTGNNAIRKVDTNGVITTVAGTFIPNPLPANPVSGAPNDAFIGINGPAYVAAGPTGPTVQIPNTEPSGDGGPATAAYLNAPWGIALDSTGNLLYIADSGNHVVRVVNLASGIITMVAGGYTDNSSDSLPTGATAPAGSFGPAEVTRLNFPTSVAVDSKGNVFIADSGNHRVVKVDTAGFAYVVAGVSPFTCSATVTANCSPATFSWGDNKSATSVVLLQPRTVAVDASDNVYVTDQIGIIRKLTPAPAAPATATP